MRHPDKPHPARRPENVRGPVNQDALSFVNDDRERDPTAAPDHSWPGHERLLEAHYGRLRRFCELLLSDPPEAEEVVQEVFMKAYEAATQSRAPQDWAAWLTRVAVNACRDRRRAGWWVRFRHWSDRIEEAPLPARDPSPAEAAIHEETRRRIWRAFRSLPDRQREVFVLRYIEEWSTSEVASTLGLSSGSVKRHLFRALRRLRDGLGGTP